MEEMHDNGNVTAVVIAIGGYITLVYYYESKNIVMLCINSLREQSKCLT